ncbi:MAG TPA: potassium/proton antiporter [Chryseosolibacter sp.]
MSLRAENILLWGSILLFLSIISSKTSFRVGIPTLILFLIIGMLAGSDGPGGIYFNDPGTAQLLGVIALTFILFSGGLDTKWESIKPVIRNGLSLSTIGVVLTGTLVGIFSAYILDFTIYEGLLLGAIVSSTDAAAVFSILRAKNFGLKGTIRPLLELESGSNDPMAYFLTISMIYLIQNPEASFWALVPKFFIDMILGVTMGYSFGKLMSWILNRIQLNIDGLYPVLVLSLVFFTFSFTERIGGNGFLAVYISAIILGNSNFIHKKSLMRFYDGQAWLMQIVMFLTLGLLVFPGQTLPIMGEGILISGFLILVARPIAVFVSLAFSKDMNFRKKLFISWVGLRGAAPIVFATYPLLADVEYAYTIFHLVFFISVSSVLFQGTTLPYVAKWLHVSVPWKIKRSFPLDIELKEDLKSELIEMDIPEDSPAVGKAVVELNLPKSSFIVLIHRTGKYLTAGGDTILETGDHLLLMADSKETVTRIYQSFGVKEDL